MQQRTIQRDVAITGVGLHTGAKVSLRLLPAPADHGRVFVRVDTGALVAIPAQPSAVVATRNATTLGAGSITVGTVEHLLAALLAFGVDNVRIELDGPEPPALDGSAAGFAALLREAGCEPQSPSRNPLRPPRAIEIREGERTIAAEPADGLHLDCAIDFDHPAIGRQRVRFGPLTPERFERELAGARTFVRSEELAALSRAGLAKGGSLDNALVVGPDGLLGDGVLRWPDEFARHKALDLLGDLAVLGRELHAMVRVERGGHALHQRLVSALAASGS